MFASDKRDTSSTLEIVTLSEKRLKLGQNQGRTSAWANKAAA